MASCDYFQESIFRVVLGSLVDDFLSYDLIIIVKWALSIGIQSFTSDWLNTLFFDPLRWFTVNLTWLVLHLEHKNLFLHLKCHFFPFLSLSGLPSVALVQKHMEKVFFCVWLYSLSTCQPGDWRLRVRGMSFINVSASRDRQSSWYQGEDKCFGIQI